MAHLFRFVIVAFLLLVQLVSPIFPSSLVASSSPAGPQAVIFDGWGETYDVFMTDTRSSPGARCRPDGQVHINPIQVTGNAAARVQPVSGVVRLWEMAEDGEIIRQLTAVNVNAWVGGQNGNRDFLTNTVFFDYPRISGNYRVERSIFTVEVYWHEPEDLYGTTDPIGAIAFLVENYTNQRLATVDGYCSHPKPACSVSAPKVKYQDVLGIACTKFRARENVSFYLDSTDNQPFATAKSTAAGDVSIKLPIPRVIGGSHRVIAIGDLSALRGSKSFSIAPKVTLSPRSGPAGTRITVRVYGYLPGDEVLIRWYRTDTKWGFFSSVPIVVGQDGYGAKTFTIPAVSSVGGHRIESINGSALSASAVFSVHATPSGNSGLVDEPTYLPSPTASLPPRVTPDVSSTASLTATPIPSTTPESVIETVEASPVD